MWGILVFADISKAPVISTGKLFVGPKDTLFSLKWRASNTSFTIKSIAVPSVTPRVVVFKLIKVEESLREVILFIETPLSVLLLTLSALEALKSSLEKEVIVPSSSTKLREPELIYSSPHAELGLPKLKGEILPLDSGIKLPLIVESSFVLTNESIKSTKLPADNVFPVPNRFFKSALFFSAIF